VATERVDVVGAELIDDEQDNKRRLRHPGRADGRRLRDHPRAGGQYRRKSNSRNG
jgi:hypothetical protein